MNLADDPTLHLPCCDQPHAAALERLPSTAPNPPYRPGRIGDVVVVDPDLLLTPGMP